MWIFLFPLCTYLLTCPHHTVAILSYTHGVLGAKHKGMTAPLSSNPIYVTSEVEVVAPFFTSRRCALSLELLAVLFLRAFLGLSPDSSFDERGTFFRRARGGAALWAKALC